MKLPSDTYRVIAERGAALVVSLVMLVVVTLIGVSVMSNSHLELLMTNNSHFQSDAFMLAEATLKAAEGTIPDDNATITWGDPFYNDDAPPNPDALRLDPNQPSSWNIYTAPAPAILNFPASTTENYVIDYLGSTIISGAGPCGAIGSECIYTYRVWARSISSSGASRILRSTYAVTISASLAPERRGRIAFAEISP